MVPDGPRCGCGRRGCLEALAGRLVVAGAAAAAAHRGEAPHLLEHAGMDLSNMKSGALASAIKAGDTAVETIVRDAAGWIGVATGMIVNILAPDTIVLGGGMVEAMPDIFLEEVKRSAAVHILPPFEGMFRVVVARLGDEATVMGAAAWAEREIARSAPARGENGKGAR